MIAIAAVLYILTVVVLRRFPAGGLPAAEPAARARRL